MTASDVELLLKKAKLRRNELRTNLLLFLMNQAKPLSHSEILDHNLFKNLDRVTIYRTLTKFQEAKLLHVIEGIDGIRRYCAHDPGQLGCPGNHPHFFCEGCLTMTCLTDQRMPRVDVEEGALVRGKQLVVYGLCPDCAKKSPIGKIRQGS
ncbi:MAG: transcriptional repressor [Spirochaetales bacterium]|nr:transcriptional repressor [Spirochaetales bacterium]